MHGPMNVKKKKKERPLLCSVRSIVTCFINTGRHSFSDEWLQISLTASIHSIPNRACKEYAR
jgi:hypothetical protein